MIDAIIKKLVPIIHPWGHTCLGPKDIGKMIEKRRKTK